MFKEVQLSEIEADGFLHSRINEFIYDGNNKIFILHLNHADLKIKGSFYSCIIKITDWWDLEVLHYRGKEVIDCLKGPDVPELDSIVDYSYDGNMLILQDICGRDEVYHFKFTKPKIKITGEYDPD